MDRWRSWLLFLATGSPLFFAGLLIADLEGALIGLVINLGLCLGIFGTSDRIVLRASRAVPIDKKSGSLLYATTRSLATWADLTPPRLYLVDAPEPNAFTVGTYGRTPAVILTSGLLQLLDQEELRGVIAHQISHIKLGDHHWSTYAAALLAIASRFFGTACRHLVAPLVRLSSTRCNELEADAYGVCLAGSPVGLLRALPKVAGGARFFRVNRHTLPLYVALPLMLPHRLNRFHPRPEADERLRHLRQRA